MEKLDAKGLTEKEFLKQYDPDKYTKPSLTADILVFLSKEDGTWKVDELQILKSEIKNGGK